MVSSLDVDFSTDLAEFQLWVDALGLDDAQLSVGSRLLTPGSTNRVWRREAVLRVYNLLEKPFFILDFLTPNAALSCLRVRRHRISLRAARLITSRST